MKRTTRLFSIVLLIVLTFTLVSELVLAADTAAFSIPVPTASGTSVKKTDKAHIDYSNVKDGYVMCKYLSTTDKKLRVVIKGPDSISYTYTLKPGNIFEVYPLSGGDGNYTIGVYEQNASGKYATCASLTTEVKLTNEYVPFLTPNQYVNYNKDSKTVAKANEIVKSTDKLMDKVSTVYNYVIDNITYDKELAANVKSGYLPNVDAILEKGKGICFDYAAVMATMLRSQGIPTKLVVGYTGETYHAWINVYSSETGWINTAIYFDGKTWKLLDPTFASSAKNSKSSDDISKYIGEAKNYTAKFVY